MRLIFGLNSKNATVFRIIAASLSLLIIATVISAQNNYSFKSDEVIIKKAASVNLSDVKDDWMPVLQSVNFPFPDENEEELERIKLQLKQKYSIQKNCKTQQVKHIDALGEASSPIVQRNFEGNIIGGGGPNDNDMAISDGGKVVSVINSIIYVFDINNLSAAPWKKSLGSFSLSKIVNDAFNNYKYDPKVIYDPNADRFIISYLNGVKDNTSKAIVAFSQTNDPTGTWNIYILSGNPLSNTLWSDYPMISITKEDFFLTLNLLHNNQSWQLGFVETVIWQIKKDDGYNGQSTITTTMYSGIQSNGRNIRNLCPVKGGREPLGPNMYFVSDRNLTLGNDSIFLVEVTNSLSSQSATLRIKVGKSNVEYYVPPTARQANNDSLQTNDARILGAFLHNNQIQFVNNTLDTSTGFSAIYHGIVKNLSSDNIQVTANIIGDSEMDFAYPNISYSGSTINYGGLSEGENEAIITFGHTSPQSFAGISAVYYSSDGKYSSVTRIKSGDTLIDLTPLGYGANDRWGDYSGSQRKYDEPGKVWVAGTFGKKTTTGTKKNYGTWIAEVSSPNSPIKPVETSELLVFPNPSADIFSLNFTLEKDAELTFKIYDMKGSLVQTLMEEGAKAGQNIFSFSTIPLSTGVYYLSIEAEGSVILKKKIVKG